MTAYIVMTWDEYTHGGFLGSSALHDWPHMSREGWSARHLEGAYQGGAGAAAAAGSALDALLTGSPARYVVKPEGMSFATKEGKAWKAENVTEGQDILDAETMAEIKAALRPARRAVETLAMIHGDPLYQLTLRGEIEGLSVQTRPDIAFPGYLLDLKYINSGSFEAFERQFLDGRYFLQAGLFRALSAAPVRVAFLLVESGTLYPRCKVLEVSGDVLEAASEAVRVRCSEIVAGKDEGLVDAPEFAVIELPEWAKKRVTA